MITVGQRLQMKAEKGFCFDVALASLHSHTSNQPAKIQPQKGSTTGVVHGWSSLV